MLPNSQQCSLHLKRFLTDQTWWRKRLSINSKSAGRNRVHRELSENVFQLELGVRFRVSSDLFLQTLTHFSNEDHHGLHLAGSEDRWEGRAHFFPLVATQVGQLTIPGLKQDFDYVIHLTDQNLGQWFSTWWYQIQVRACKILL